MRGKDSNQRPPGYEGVSITFIVYDNFPQTIVIQRLFWIATVIISCNLWPFFTSLAPSMPPPFAIIILRLTSIILSLEHGHALPKTCLPNYAIFVGLSMMCYTSGNVHRRRVTIRKHGQENSASRRQFSRPTALRLSHGEKSLDYQCFEFCFFLFFYHSGALIFYRVYRLVGKYRDWRRLTRSGFRQSASAPPRCPTIRI